MAMRLHWKSSRVLSMSNSGVWPRNMRDERPGHTLQTTALVNEAYLRLNDWENIQWRNRAHFFAVAGQMTRRILADHARSRQNRKRGGVGIGFLSSKPRLSSTGSPRTWWLWTKLSALLE